MYFFVGERETKYLTLFPVRELQHEINDVTKLTIDVKDIDKHSLS